jgi:hypothetical protein
VHHRFDNDRVTEQSRSTVLQGHTTLYTGNSSDQDVYLLRHLPFDRNDHFGQSNWRVWKVLADERAPAYFTVGDIFRVRVID